jgi:hypothetical protein
MNLLSKAADRATSVTKSSLRVLFSIAKLIKFRYFMAEMIATATSPKKKFSRENLETADRLLKAVKEKLLREKGKIDYAALRRNGYSEELIARLKQI